MPSRIQRRRTAGWRLPEGAVIVDRTSRFGNPFRVGDRLVIRRGGKRYTVDVMDAQTAVDLFGDWINLKVHLAGEGARRAAVLAALPRLTGRDLCCPCPLDQPCHGDVLLELANPNTPPEETTGGDRP